MDIDFSKFTVLAVDDIPTNTLLIKMTLEQSGLRVITAQNAEEAFQLIEQERPDLILLDVLMPGIDGFEMARQLKEHPEHKWVPIIFLTALDSTTDIVKGFQLGADDYVTKPFNKEELIVRVSHQIQLLEAKRTIEQQKKELEEIIAGRDAMYSVIAHDLRMPMATMKMILNVLFLKIKENEHTCNDLLESVQSANEICEELYILLDNLLKWTKSQLGRLKALPQFFYLGEFIKGGVEVAAAHASTKNIGIRFESVNNEETGVYADTDMIKTAVRNLINNAIKYSYRDSEITISIEREADRVICKVADTGCGICEKDQARLLNPATHFTTYGTENESGSGLGLLLTDTFLKLNNGLLFFHSKQGEGSTFGFSLPAHTGK